MPIHDFQCINCNHEFEELHKQGEEGGVSCPLCSSPTQMLVSRLADYTGLTSRTVQYTTRNAPKHMQDSHLTKISKDTNFLANPIQTQKAN